MNDARIHIDPTAKVHPTAIFEVAADSELRIESGATIGPNVHIEIAEEGRVTIGKNARIANGVTINGHADVTIGDSVRINPYSVIDTCRVVRFERDPSVIVPQKSCISIGNGSVIGAHAVVSGGACIGDHCIVAPHAQVSDDVAAGTTISSQHPAAFVDRSPYRSTVTRILFGFARSTDTAQQLVVLANTLRSTGADTRLYCSPAAANNLAYINNDRLIVRPDAEQIARDLDDLLPELIILWSGATQSDQLIVAAAKARQIPIRYVELGWFPQSRSVYFDFEGTNARSSIRKLNLSECPVDPRLDDWLDVYRSDRRAERPDIEGEYVFVPLQDIRDANITLASPYKSMDEFVSALAEKFPNERFVIRPHPHFYDVPLTPYDNITVRRDLSIHPWLHHATAVVGINSTALLESLAIGKPTHSVGVGLSTGLNVMFESEGVESMTLHREIDDARNDRNRRFLSELVFTRQAWKKDLHYVDRLHQIYGLSDLIEPQSTIISESSKPQSAILARTTKA